MARVIQLASVLSSPVIPVVVVEDVAHAELLREAITAGGLSCVEVTCRTAAAADAIRAMASDGNFVVGAGTVLTAGQVETVVEAGARFVVSPGLSRSVALACEQAGVAYLPGAVTASEIMAVLDLGLVCVKFFPAEMAGGVAAIAALSAPFPDVSFVPTGGVRPAMLSTYLSCPGVKSVGGTWLTPAESIHRGDVADIQRRVREAVDIAATAR